MRKKKNILDDREQVISKAEAKFFEIYSEIMDADELSIYQSELLTNKMLILSTELDEYMKVHDEFIEKLKIKCKNVVYVYLVISLIQLPLMFLAPLISVIISFFKFKMMYNYNDKFEAASKKDYLTNLQQIKIAVDNCTTFLKVKNNKREERIAELDLTDQIRANNFLQAFLEADDVSQLLVTLNNCNDAIKNILLKMLQDDLQISSDNLEELLNIARSKVSMETLQSELKLSRILPKKAGK